jgi:hypothetical protein
MKDDRHGEPEWSAVLRGQPHHRLELRQSHTEEQPLIGEPEPLPHPAATAEVVTDFLEGTAESLRRRSASEPSHRDREVGLGRYAG